MNTVQPIKDIAKIRKMEKILKEQNVRDYILFELGIYSALRISDILKLKVKDLRNKNYFELVEQKTGKTKKLAINPDLKKELAKYFVGKDDEEYVIGSRERNLFTTIKDKESGKKVKVLNTSPNSPISRVQAWNILNDAAKKAGITEQIGTHSLRKTFGYHMYNHCGKDVTIVQEFLNHSSPKVTLVYIGIDQDNKDELICTLQY
ncbi:MAG TPA: tyrosine-type recombinase/integrase [Acholeplasmataceae bacterium]|nr:tyrosine-type recombinase/integrase [Acholeplasmataceae bacterium]